MKIILFLWQLPQNILALLVIAFFKLLRRCWYQTSEMVSKHNKVFIYYVLCPTLGVSLGNFIILDINHNANSQNHEIGHCKQSLYFGPLYLFVIGIPSALFNNLWSRIFHKKWTIQDNKKWYYNRYPEKWADTLGGVKRW